LRNDIAPTLTAGANSGGNHSEMACLKVKDTVANQAVVQPYYEDIEIGDIRYDEGGFRPRKNGIAPALVGSNNKSGTPNCSILKNNQTYRIRRLTPIECERLQGFPDNHTEYGNYEGEVKKMSNTQRYKQCGNAVTVDIVSLVANAVKPLFK
jgi:DNA (cytosine-5)-methyltransferase 1